MGGKMSCCKHSSDERRPNHQRRKNVVPSMHDSRLPVYTESLNSIQHISERDGNLDSDDRTDPSQYPKAKTIFMERSQENGHGSGYGHSYGYAIESGTNNGYGTSDTSGSYVTAKAAHNSSIGSTSSSSAVAAAKRRRQSQLYYQNHDQHQPSEPRSLKKSSSCSTIFLDDSTVSQPNLKNTVKCVSLAIYYHIKNRTSQRELPIFDERLHPLTRDNRLNGFVIDDYLNRNPEHKHIYKFIRVLFNSAQLTAECAIVTLIYLERLLTYAELDIAPSNWKRILLGAILLASKVWDDQAVWNVDYCHILKDVTVDDMNALEKEFLELLQFNINVPSSIYAKYYFDLRTLAEQNNLSFPSEPLSRERAQKLEAMSRVIENRLVNEIGLAASIKKWSSLDNLTCSARRSVAILS